MSHKVNLVRVFTSATGNSTPITLGAAYSQLFMTPAEAGAMDGRIYTYLIVDGNDWEMGRGAYTASGTALARTTIIASRISGTLGTSRITLTGTAQVRFIEAAEDMDGVRGTRVVTGTSDVLANSDQGYVVTYSNASPIAVSLAQAGSSNLFQNGWATMVQNTGAGTVTVTPATSTINGNAALALASGMGAFIWSDGTNYRAYFIPAGKPALAANNLSDVSAAPARSNIGLSFATRTITGSDTIIASDIGKTLIFNSASAFTLAITAAATLGNGFWCRFKNVNSGLVTIDPNSSETVDGNATTVVPKNDSGIIACDGAGFSTLERPAIVPVERGSISNAASKAIEIPDGFDFVDLDLWRYSPTSASSTVIFEISTDGGSNYLTSSYKYHQFTVDTSGTVTGQGTTSDTAWRPGGALEDSATAPANISFTLVDPKFASSIHRAEWNSSYLVKNGAYTKRFGGGIQESTGAVTHLRFYQNTGNIAAAQYAVRGRRKM